MFRAAFCLLFWGLALLPVGSRAHNTPAFSETLTLHMLNQPEDSLYLQLRKDIRNKQFEESSAFLSRIEKRVQGGKYPLAYSRWLRLKAYYLTLTGEQAYALHFLEQAYYLVEAEGWTHEMAGVLEEKAILYENLGFFEEAVAQLRVSIQVRSKVQPPEILARLYHELASLLYKAGDYPAGLQAANTSVDYGKKISDSRLTEVQRFYLMSSYNTSGLLAEKMEYYEDALLYYHQAEKEAILLKHTFWKALINGNKATVLVKLNRLEEAYPLVMHDFVISRDTHSWMSAVNAASFLTSLHLQRKEFSQAKAFLDSGHKYLQHMEGGIYDFLRTHLRLLEHEVELHRAMGNSVQLASSLEKYLHLKEKIQADELRKRLAENQAKLDLTRKQGEIVKLENLSQQKEAELVRQRTLVFSALVTGGLLVVVVFLLWQSNRKKALSLQIIGQQQLEIIQQKEELEAQGNKLQESYNMVQTLNAQLQKRVEESTEKYERTYQDLDFFLYRSSHDTRRPIATLQGLVHLLEANTGDQPTLLALVKETVRSMDSMLSKLQMVLFLKQEDRQPEPFDLGQAAREWACKVGRDFSLPENTLRVQCPEPVQITEDKLLFQIILLNLLENACTFRVQNAVTDVELRLAQKGRKVVMEVRDNGVGMEAEVIPQIFELYFRGTELSKGNGLGLYLVKEAVNLLSGKVSVQSSPGQGATFTVELFPRVV
jgi:signal transduction histidine kinase